MFSRSFIVLYTFRKETKDYDIHVSIKGAELSRLDIFQQQVLIKKLSLFELRLTRLDICLNDKSYKLIPYKKMIRAYQQGNYFYFQRYYPYQNTHYFGSKKSDRLIRIYPKDSFLRLETEFKNKCASDVFHTIKNLTTLEFQVTMVALAVGVVDFRDKGKLANPQKAYAGNTKRLPFWHNFTANKLGIEPRRL